jgi:hypothetical protein
VTRPTRIQGRSPLSPLALGAIVVLAHATSLFAGTLHTRDGRSLEGAIAPAGSSALSVTPKDAESVTIELSSIRSATFPTTAPATRPTTWQHQDVGRAHVPGAAEEVSSPAGPAYHLVASGYGFWGPRDSGHLLYWPFEGDGQIIAHVAHHGDEGTGVAAGVMFRDSIDPDSPMAAAMIYPSGEARFVRRPVKGWVGGPEQQVPQKYEWVRLTRQGQELTAYRSRDGMFWTPVGSQPVPLAGRGLACLAAASLNNACAGPAAFDHLRVIAGTPSTTCFEGAAGPTNGIVLTDGTMLAGNVDRIENGKVSFLPRFAAVDGSPTQRPHTDAQRAASEQKKQFVEFKLDDVARARFAPEPPELAKFAPPGATGVLLLGGDFLEADVQRLAYGEFLDVNSVLFGAKRMSARGECICAVLRDVKPRSAAYEVRLRDGSIINAARISLAGDLLVVESPLTGSLKYPLAELAALESH